MSPLLPQWRRESGHSGTSHLRHQRTLRLFNCPDEERRHWGQWDSWQKFIDCCQNHANLVVATFSSSFFALKFRSPITFDWNFDELPH
jgi:hypothetical protein